MLRHRNRVTTAIAALVISLIISSPSLAYEFHLLGGMVIKGDLAGFDGGAFRVVTDVGEIKINTANIDYIIVEESDAKDADSSDGGGSAIEFGMPVDTSSCPDVSGIEKVDMPMALAGHSLSVLDSRCATAKPRPLGSWSMSVRDAAAGYPGTFSGEPKVAEDAGTGTGSAVVAHPPRVVLEETEEEASAGLFTAGRHMKPSPLGSWSMSGKGAGEVRTDRPAGNGAPPAPPETDNPDEPGVAAAYPGRFSGNTESGQTAHGITEDRTAGGEGYPGLFRGGLDEKPAPLGSWSMESDKAANAPVEKTGHVIEPPEPVGSSARRGTGEHLQDEIAGPDEEVEPDLVVTYEDIAGAYLEHGGDGMPEPLEAHSLPGEEPLNEEAAAGPDMQDVPVVETGRAAEETTPPVEGAGVTLSDEAEEPADETASAPEEEETPAPAGKNINKKAAPNSLVNSFQKQLGSNIQMGEKDQNWWEKLEGRHKTGAEEDSGEEAPGESGDGSGEDDAE